MDRHHGQRARWLAGATALAVASSLAVAAPAGAAITAGTLAERITALRAGKADWRAELASPLAGLRGARTVTGPVRGTVAAATVTVSS